MKRCLFMAMMVAAAPCLYQQIAGAQGGEPEKSAATRFEVAAQFSSITFSPDQTQPGAGARFTFNFNDNFALEAEANYFPNDNGRFSTNRDNGRATQALFGVKAGKRFKNFGIFAKARPGFISFTRGIVDVVATAPATTPGGFPFFELRSRRLTHAALDTGAALEFYPSRRLVTRFDIGVTTIFMRETTFQGFTGIGPDIGPIRAPAETRAAFQFGAGIGYRW